VALKPDIGMPDAGEHHLRGAAMNERGPACPGRHAEALRRHRAAPGETGELAATTEPIKLDKAMKGRPGHLVSGVIRHLVATSALIVVAATPMVASAQPWSGIIASSRAIDWTASGIPGGIPSRTTICATINASTYGNGG